MSGLDPRHDRSALLGALALAIVATLTMSTQALGFSTATVYNPLSLSNTVITQGRVGHAVTYFQGWTTPFAIDIASNEQYADREIYLWGVGWSTANVGTGSPGNNAPATWDTYSNTTCTSKIGVEHAIGFLLNLPNGQTAGFSVSHLSNYHYVAGAQVNQGAQVANLSWLSASGPIYAIRAQDGVCIRTASAPHVHVESARRGTTTFNDVDPGATGAAGNPYWYWNYP